METLGDEADRKLANCGIIASRHVVEGDPVSTLVNEARIWNSDAVFMGARRHGPVERLLVGSVSASVITHAPCTVEIAPPFKP